MDTHLKLHAIKVKQLTQMQMHPLHNLNAYLTQARKMKATIFHNNEHKHHHLKTIRNTIGSKEKLKHTFTLSSSHNTSVLQKTTKFLTPHSMTFIHQNKHYNVICIQNWHSSEPTNHHSCKATYMQ